MAEYPYLPLFTDAFLASTDHLSDAETGLYLRLLMLMWRSPECRIPDDDAWLCRRLRLTDAIAVRSLCKEFCRSHVDHGRWLTQKRLRKEWGYVNQRREKASASAKSRWDKEKDISERNATQQCDGNAPNLSYPIKKEEVLVPSAPNTPVGYFPLFWSSYPKRTGANPKAPAEKLFTAAVKSGVNPETIIDAVKRCAEIDKAKIGTEFIPQAVKWLRDKRWQDYPPVANGATNGQSGFYAANLSKQLEAWDKYRRATTGTLCPRDKNGGWRVPSEWPPELTL